VNVGRAATAEPRSWLHVGLGNRPAGSPSRWPDQGHDDPPGVILGARLPSRPEPREKAAEFREQQDKLEQLAVDYFVAADSLDEIDAATEKEIAAVRARAEKQSADARAEAEAVMQKMLALGITRAEVASRLGVAVRDVKKVPAGDGGDTSPTGAAQPSEGDGESAEAPAEQREGEPSFA
jgi:hypothetical protein